MRVTSKGQITIPHQVRRELDLEPGDEIDVVVEGDTARIVRIDATSSRGQRTVDRLRGSATADLDMTTDELLALLRDDD